MNGARNRLPIRGIPETLHPIHAPDRVGEEQFVSTLQGFHHRLFLLYAEPGSGQALQQVTPHYACDTALGQRGRKDPALLAIEQVGDRAVGDPALAVEHQAIIELILFGMQGSQDIEQEIIRFQVGKAVTGLPSLRKEIDDQSVLIESGALIEPGAAPRREGPGFNNIIREMIFRIVQTALPAKDHQSHPGQGGMPVLFAKPEDLVGQLMGPEKSRQIKAEQTRSSQQTLKMIVAQDDTALLYFDRFKQTIPITKSPVICPDDRCVRRKDLPVKINVGAYLTFRFTVVR